MRLRVSQPSWGAERFVFGLLGAFLAALVAGVVVFITYLIARSVPSCKADELGFCAPAAAGIAGFVGLIATLFVTAYVFRLGWRWAGWMVALLLLLTQIVIDANNIYLGWIGFLIPFLATGITYPRPESELPQWMRRAVDIVMILAMVEFIIWLIVLMVAP